jgi:hypothetical protein
LLKEELCLMFEADPQIAAGLRMQERVILVKMLLENRLHEQILSIHWPLAGLVIVEGTKRDGRCRVLMYLCPLYWSGMDTTEQGPASDNLT